MVTMRYLRYKPSDRSEVVKPSGETYEARQPEHDKQQKTSSSEERNDIRGSRLSQGFHNHLDCRIKSDNDIPWNAPNTRTK